MKLMIIGISIFMVSLWVGSALFYKAIDSYLSFPIFMTFFLGMFLGIVLFVRGLEDI